LYQNDNHIFGGGVNYNITPLQLLGVQADYASGNTSAYQEYTMQRIDPSNNYNKILVNKTRNGIKARTFAGALFYRGQITNRLLLLGDLSYSMRHRAVREEVFWIIMNTETGLFLILTGILRIKQV
jgi:hypothetical protein